MHDRPGPKKIRHSRGDSTTLDRYPSVPAGHTLPVFPETGNPQPSKHLGFTVSRLEVARNSLPQRGFSEAAGSVAADTRRRSNVVTYDSRLREFGEWCQNRRQLPPESSLAHKSKVPPLIVREGQALVDYQEL